MTWRGAVIKSGRAQVRAAAAFIRADEWHVFYRLPTAAWREHGPTITTSLRPDDVGSNRLCARRSRRSRRSPAQPSGYWSLSHPMACNHHHRVKSRSGRPLRYPTLIGAARRGAVVS